MTEKQCTKCGRVLPIESFSQRKLTSGIMSHYNQCKDCRKELIATWKEAHKKPPFIKVCEHCNKEYDTYQPKSKYCSEDCSKGISIDRRNHLAYIKTLDDSERVEYKKQYYKQWFEGNRNKVRLWYEENKEHCKIKAKIRHEERMCNDIDYRLKTKIRSKIYKVLKGNKNSISSMELIGCSINELRQHIERQFQPGMTWDNWGTFGWHLDHIIPQSSFDFTDVEQQKRCWHYTNLQPLWWMDNIMKSDNIYTQQLTLM